MSKRYIIITARILSAIFNPFYLPVVGLIILCTFSYLKFLPWNYKLFTLLMVYTITVLLPTTLIKYYRKYQGWSRIELARKDSRLIPYVIAFFCYFLCFYLLSLYHAPHIIGSIVVASLTIQAVCAIINLKLAVCSALSWRSRGCSPTTPCGGCASSSWWEDWWPRAG